MKKGIHPQYYSDAVIKCACGNVIKTGSTKQEMHTEICSACHPFYTGKKKVIDTTGRVDRFKKRMEKAAELKDSSARTKKEKKAAKREKKVTAKKKQIEK